MSALSICALAALLAVLFAGVYVISRLLLAKLKPGQRVRVKAPFIEIEAGPATADDKQVNEKAAEPQPPEVEPPKSSDKAPPG